MVMNINSGGYPALDKTKAHAQKTVNSPDSPTSPAEARPNSSNSSADHDSVKLTALPETRATTPPVNQQRIAALSQAISDGRYSVDTEQLANDIITQETELYGAQ